jgi:predicted nucleic acid-binding protein
MMALCVDASIGVKWFVPEEGQQEALALLAECNCTAQELVIPDLFFVEVANGLCHHFLSGDLTESELQEAGQELAGLAARAVPAADVIASAVELAGRYSLTTWDAIYLAVAESEAATLWTADRDFAHLDADAIEIRVLEWEAG